MRRLFLIPVLMLLTGVALSAQIVAGFGVGLPASSRNPNFGTFSAQGDVDIALPSLPHILPMWRVASVGFDRLRGSNGGSIATGLEVWISPAVRPALSHAPILLAEADVGRRFGYGLHGFTTLGAGVGWSLGGTIPFIEYRRREGFHAGRVIDNQIVVGVQFTLFG